MPQGNKKNREVDSLIEERSSIRNILNVALEKGGIKGGYMGCREVSDPLDTYRVFKLDCYDGKKYLMKLTANTNDEYDYIYDIEEKAFESGSEFDSLFNFVSAFETIVVKGFLFEHEPLAEASEFTSLTFKNNADKIGKSYREIHSLSLPSEEPLVELLEPETPESILNAFSYILEFSKSETKVTCVFPSELDDIYVTQSADRGIDIKFLDLSSCSKWNPALDLATASVMFKLDYEAIESMCAAYGNKDLAPEVDELYELACLLIFVKAALSKKDNPLVRDMGKILEKTKKTKIKSLYKEIKNDI